MNRKILPIILLSLSALALAGCGSSGGGSTPPAPPAPVTPPAPPPPPPEPTFEERLEDLAEHDPNPCRARTPGFEALGGWLKNDGRELTKSRVWVDDQGALDDPSTHGATVWETFTDCAARSTEDQYARAREEGNIVVSIGFDKARADGRDLIISESSAPPYRDIPFPAPVPLSRFFPETDGERDGQRILFIQGLGNDDGKRTGFLQNASFQGALEAKDTALWILVGGYTGEGDNRAPAGASSICSEADPLCLFAPWRGSSATGTSQSTPQVSAALDTVWAVWPDMDILDLRNLAFDCAENMPAPEGETATTRSYSYKNGRSFTSDTNSTWGHGILSMTCLFTPNGGLQNPVGTAISGGIFGPLAGPVTGASITGVDYTGRDFGYGFARPVARENFALVSLTQAAPRGWAAPANLSASGAFFGSRVVPHAVTKVRGDGAAGPASGPNLVLAAAGNAIGLATEWRFRGLTIRGGVAAQPEGVGSLTGSRAFRAPSALSAAITAAYGRAMPKGFSAHLQADHWRTLATHGRSLWEGAEIRESRVSAALVKRVDPREGVGHHEFALQAVWRSGLSGALDVDGRSWALSPRAESGVWLTWTARLPRS